MKKSIAIIIILGICAILGLIYFVFWHKSDPSYLKVVEKNWNISLPRGCALLYKSDSGPSFHGDGERYHVFKYEDDVIWNEPFYELRVTENDEERILEIIDNLNINKEFYPDFENINYGLIKKKGMSTLYVCYSLHKMLYVIEDIY